MSLLCVFPGGRINVKYGVFLLACMCVCFHVLRFLLFVREVRGGNLNLSGVDPDGAKV